MPLTIYPLPAEVIHRIGAGEVIDSLAAVVRELAENALDAGATRVAITLDLERWSVRVADNGQGMGLDDLQQAAQPHTTSKLGTCQDLSAIHSLGFRGEALHSLAQLSELEICSRPPLVNDGWRVRYDAEGSVVDCESVAIAPGTIVTASLLFASWPQRRKAMPSPSQQLRQVQLTVQHLALCHPTVTWTVTQEHRDGFSIFPGQTPKTILPQVVRNVQPDDLREHDAVIASDALAGHGTSSANGADANHPDPNVPKRNASGPNRRSPEPSPCRMYVLAGLPDRCHRRRADWVKVAINGRMVRFPELEQVIIGAFRRTMPRDRHPICFVHLTVPVDQVDWNRHPAKLEVYLHHLAAWQAQIRGAIAHLLTLHSSHLSDRYFSGRVAQLIKTAESGQSYRAVPEPSSAEWLPDADDETDSNAQDVEHQDDTEASGGDCPSIQPLPQHGDTPLSSLRAIAQVHDMYILAEHPDGMWLVEQHIAHERVVYEQLCDRWQVVEAESPVILNHLTPAQREQLQRLTLEVEPFGDTLWAVRTLPAALAKREDCADALVELSLGGDVEEAIVATACRTAIRNGTPLSRTAMQFLLDQWLRTRNPRTCPHGRPIYLALEESRLSRFFRRHWVIGKSHGI